MISKQLILLMMEVDGSEKKTYIDVAKLEKVRAQYRVQKNNFKPKQGPDILGILILLVGLFIEALLTFNHNPSTCNAVEVPSFFECGSDGIILITCILLSSALFLISAIAKSKYKKWKVKMLQHLIKVSNYSKISTKSIVNQETSILSHVKSLLNGEE